MTNGIHHHRVFDHVKSKRQKRYSASKKLDETYPITLHNPLGYTRKSTRLILAALSAST